MLLKKPALKNLALFILPTLPLCLGSCKPTNVTAEREPVLANPATSYPLTKPIALSKNTFFFWQEPKTMNHVGQASFLANQIQDMDDERATLDEKGAQLDRLLADCRKLPEEKQSRTTQLEAEVAELMKSCPSTPVAPNAKSCTELVQELDTWANVEDLEDPENLSSTYSTRRALTYALARETWRVNPSQSKIDEELKPGVEAMDAAIAGAWETKAGEGTPLAGSYPVMPALIAAKRELRGLSAEAGDRDMQCRLAVALLDKWIAGELADPSNEDHDAELPAAPKSEIADRAALRVQRHQAIWKRKVNEAELRFAAGGRAVELLAENARLSAVEAELDQAIATRDQEIRARWVDLLGESSESKGDRRTNLGRAFPQMLAIGELKQKTSRLDSDGNEAVNLLQGVVKRWQTAPSQIFFEREASGQIRVRFIKWAVDPNEVNSDNAANFLTDGVKVENGVRLTQKFTIENARYTAAGGKLDFDAVVYSGNFADRLEYQQRQVLERYSFNLQRVKDSLSQRTKRIYYSGKFTRYAWMPVLEMSADGSFRTQKVSLRYRKAADGWDRRVPDAEQGTPENPVFLKEVTIGVPVVGSDGQNVLEFREACDPVDSEQLCRGQVSLSGGL